MVLQQIDLQCLLLIRKFFNLANVLMMVGIMDLSEKQLVNGSNSKEIMCSSDVSRSQSQLEIAR